MSKYHVVQFIEDDSDSYEDTDSNCSCTQDTALLGSNSSLNDRSAKRRSLYQRGLSGDSHSQADKEIQYEYSIELRFKKAVEGCETYFQYWSNRIQNDFSEREKFLEYERQGAEMSILHYAAQHYKQEICEILIEKFQFDPNIATRKNMTPLHVAVKFNSKLKTAISVQEFNTESFLNVTPTRSRANTMRNSEALVGTIGVFLKNRADVNAQDINGFTPLHYAAMKDNHVAAEQLIPIANTKIKDDQDMTPLHVACKYGSEQVFNLLVQKETPIDLACNLDIKFSLPLHHACSCKVEKENMVDRMLELLKSYDENNQTDYLKRALEQRNWRNKTALHLCIENNHVKLVELLCMKYKADVNLRGGSIDNYPIHMAAKIGSERIMDILESSQANLYALNRKEENLLHIAACTNQPKFILKFLERERSNLHKNKYYVPAVHAINIKQQTPLLCAAFYGNTDCVDVLLRKGRANIEDKDLNENTIFHLCAIRDNIQIFKYLLEPNSCFLTKSNFLPVLKQSDKDDNTVVHLACKHGHIDILKFIFSSKLFDYSMIELIFAKNIKEQTGFHIACLEGHYNIVNYFLTMKNFNTSSLIQDVDEDFNTGLHLASIKGYHRLVDLLIRHGASIEARNSKDWSALDIASYYGWVKAAETLLQNDALMYVRGCKMNPLLLASSNGKKDIVNLLLNYNAKITITNNSEENCLDLALKHEHKSVVETILNNKNWMDVIDKVDNNQYEILINVMPDMMEILLNKIEEKKAQTKKYDFSVLDLDFDNVAQHPLMIMAESRHENLLRHPVTQKLIELKWKKFPQYIYLLNLFLYFIFVILLSVHVVTSNRSMTVNVTNSGNYSDIEEGTTFKIVNQELVVYTLTLTLLVFHIIKELAQFLNDGLNYFYRLDNLIELSTYTLTLLFMIPICGGISHSNDNFQFSKGKITFHRCDWQWQLGSICILLAWIVFVFFIEKFKIFGKYVVMFHRILLNSLKFFPVFLLFILGFALSFSMLLGDKENDFGKFSTAIMKTISMMIGELEFKDVFIEKSWANYVVYALFVSLMCIIIFNLLVGLAVGDINKVETEAYVELIIMKIDFILQMQKSFRGKCFGSDFMRFETETEIDETKMNIFHKFFKNFLNLLYRAFNKSSNSTDDYRENEVNTQEALTKTIQELQINMNNNFNTMHATVGKLRNEIKFMKTQLKTSQALITDVKKNVLRQRCISN